LQFDGSRMTEVGTNTDTAVRGSPFRNLLRVAAADQRHEILLTACLVVSIVAVLVPLLLLYSVKVGFVERVRSDLIRDPSFREIQPAEADIKSPERLAEYANLQGTGFFVPSVLLSPRDIPFTALVDIQKRTGEARLVPTGEGDPLLNRITGQWNSSTGDTVVVSRDLAEKFRLSIGSSLDLLVARTENRKTRREILTVTISGVLPPEATNSPTILASQRLDQDVENYRAGVAVPKRGWPAIEAPPKQAFPYVLIAAPRALDEVEQRDFLLNIGGVAIVPLANPETGYDPLYALVGLEKNQVALPAFALRPGLTHFYLLKNGTAVPQPGRFYTASDTEEAQQLAARISGLAFGALGPWTLTLGDQTRKVASPDPRLFVGLRATSYPWRFGKAALLEENLKTYIRTGDRILLNQGTAAFAAQDYKDAPVLPGLPPVQEAQAFVAEGQVLVSPALLGMLSRGMQVPLQFDPSHKRIVENATGLRGFRLVAATLDDVPRLVAAFEARGIPVRAKSDAIVKLQRLDRSLTLLVAVLSAVSFLGGLAVMTATCISNVKRKAVQYATLRLVGLGKAQVFVVPVLQSLTAALAAVVIGLLLYKVLSILVNRFVAALVDFDGELSRLDYSHIAIASFLVISGSALASLLAAREATAIDPSLALRGSP
jgi:putative ABC transport system permease protein